MAGGLRTLERPALAGVLFAEDFDDTPEAMVIAAAPEPEVIAPVFTLEDIDAVRARAHAEGRAAARAEAEAAQAAAMRAAIEAVAASLARIEADAALQAACDAEETARLLLDTLMTLLPAMCANHSEAEVRAVARAVLPALKRQVGIAVRVHPGVAGAIRDEIARIDPNLPDRVSVVPTETMAVGDVHVSWPNGRAVRDTRAVWDEIAAVLAASGLRPHAAATEETADG